MFSMSLMAISLRTFWLMEASLSRLAGSISTTMMELGLKDWRMLSPWGLVCGISSCHSVRRHTGKAGSFIIDSPGPCRPGTSCVPVLKPALLTFMAHAHSQPLDCEIVPGFRLKLWPATTVRQTFYLFGGYSDRQTTGYVIHEIEVNLRLCIEEKTRKVAAMRHKYPEWWLVLPDHIGWGLDEFDQESFRKQVSLIHSFDRVILLDPRDHTRAFRI